MGEFELIELWEEVEGVPEAGIVKLRNVIATVENEKARNEHRWSWLSSSLLVTLTLGLMVAAVITTFVVSVKVVPAALAAGTGVVGALSHLVPYDRKRIGNKILLAKACDLRERLEELRGQVADGRLDISEATEQMHKLRFEKNLLNATSSAQAALNPFRALLE